MREEIIKMAREAGFDVNFDIWAVSVDGVHINKELERFFHMAQAAEREACAKVCDQFIDAMKEVLPVERLRQTDPYKALYKANAATAIQDAIRARGRP